MERGKITPDTIGPFLESLPDPRIQTVTRVKDSSAEDLPITYLLQFEIDNSTYNIMVFYFPDDRMFDILEQLTHVDTISLDSMPYQKARQLWEWWKDKFPKTNFALAKDDHGILTISTERSAVKCSLYELEGLLSEAINQTPALVDKIRNLSTR